MPSPLVLRHGSEPPVMARVFAASLLGYLLGSIPTSVILGRWLHGIDLREHGSRNAGAANALRVLGWRPALLTAAADLAKGWLAVAAASRLAAGSDAGDPLIGIVAGLFAIAGHIWPLFAGLRGGKGVATSAGASAALVPGALAVAVAVFALVLLAMRRVSAASLSAAVALPLAIAVRGGGYRLVLFGLVAAVLILVKHRDNVRRLLEGTERRLGEP